MRRFTPQLSKETLHSIALGPAIEWAEGGAGSLDTLHLVLRLESYLDRKISIDLITLRTTPLQPTRSLLQKGRDHDDGPFLVTFRLTSSGASEYSITPDSSITNRGR